MNPQQKIDETDIKILKALINDARTSFSEIARKCGVSTALIHKRYNSLKQSGVISGTSITIIPENRFNFSLILELKVEADELQSILKTLKEIPHLRNAYPVAGKYDVHAVYLIKSFKETNEIRSILSNKKGITKIKFVSVNRDFAFHAENLVLHPTGE
ncbi:MAG: winged helix-turn-helix transcriptional regulator [Candidatus Bathyarchaeia archaeon]